jgi:hypothetical protein
MSGFPGTIPRQSVNVPPRSIAILIPAPRGELSTKGMLIWSLRVADGVRPTRMAQYVNYTRRKYHAKSRSRETELHVMSHRAQHLPMAP